MSTTRVGPGYATVCDVETTEQAVSAYRWAIVVRWAGYTGDVKFAERIAERLDYAGPHDFTTPPARARLAAYRLGGSAAVKGVLRQHIPELADAHQ